MPVRRLSILGVGLLGGSIALAARKRLSGLQVVGYGHRSSTLQTAERLGIIDEGYDGARRAVRDADLVILCTPVATFGDLIREFRTEVSPDCLITDVGSTKRSVVYAAEKDLPLSGHFLGSHPMAGSEKRGLEFARADLFDGAICILTPTPQTHPRAVQEVEAFWRLLGMRTISMSPEQHDRQVAQISHLPHALAALLAATATESAAALAGRGFADMTRIAAGDGALWRDIFLDNADNVRLGIDQLQERLNAFRSLLEPSRSDELKAFLDHAADKRRSLGNE